MKKSKIIIPLTVAVLCCAAGQFSTQGAVTIELLDTFDYPGTGNWTLPQKINDAGEIAGYYIDPSNVTRGFLRTRNGRFSPPIVDPDDDEGVTQVRGINNSGEICGIFHNSETDHGFLKGGSTFSQFDIPNADDTFIFAINDAGDFCGSYLDNLLYVDYVSIGGNVTTFLPQDNASFTSALGMNNLGQVVGDYFNKDLISHGYLRDSDGTVTKPIDPTGSVNTTLFGINDRGWMVGRFTDRIGVTHGALGLNVTTFIQWDYPGANFTSFNGISRQGLICGRYQDNAGVNHGFLARVVRSK